MVRGGLWLLIGSLVATVVQAAPRWPPGEAAVLFSVLLLVAAVLTVTREPGRGAEREATAPDGSPLNAAVTLCS